MKIASANGNPATAEKLRHFIDHDYHGDMDWLATTAERRASPKGHVARGPIGNRVCHELWARH